MVQDEQTATPPDPRRTAPPDGPAAPAAPALPIPVGDLPAVLDERLSPALSRLVRREVRLRADGGHPGAAAAAWSLLPPEEGAATLLLPAATAFGLLEMLLGGPQPPAHVPDRALTAVELAMLGRFAALLADGLRACWPEGQAPDFAPRPEPQDAEVLAGGASTIALALAVGDWVGGFTLLLEGAAAASAAVDARPARLSPVVDLSATVEGLSLAAGELADLAPGDILRTDADPQDEVVVRVAGIPKYAARLGSVNGRRAVTILRKLDGT